MAFIATDFTAPRPAELSRWPLERFGVLFAWIAVIIYAASNSIVTQLVDFGAANPIADGRNAITYSNLFVLGSALSLIPMAILFRRDLTRENICNLAPSDWRTLTISAFLSSALTPGLFFFALANTTVTNVVLISRIEPPLFLLAAWLLLNERFSTRAMTAGLVALSGAIIMIGMGQKGGLTSLGIGEWAAVAATLSYIASTIVARKGLRDVPMGIFSVYRTIVGTLFYIVLAIAIFGAHNFQDLLSPILWNWIWVYAGIVIVLGQIAWNLALKHASSGEVALATSFSPLAAIVIAMILLGENPGPGLIPGAVLIGVAIIIGRSGSASSATAQEAPRAASGVSAMVASPGQPCIGSDCHKSNDQRSPLPSALRQPPVFSWGMSGVNAMESAHTAAPPGLCLWPRMYDPGCKT